MRDLSQDRIVQLFSYENGSLIWKHRPRSDFKNNQAFLAWNTKHALRVAGYLNKAIGYVCITIDNSLHYAHRLIWIYHNGPILAGYEVDHKFSDRSDNRIERLRCVTHEINMRNVRLLKSNTSGVSGVCWDKQAEKWQAQIKVSGNYKYLGKFADKADAEKAVLACRNENGFGVSHGGAR